MSRRQLLRLFAYSALGAGLVLGARSLAGSAFSATASTQSTSTTSSSSATTTLAVSRAGSVQPSSSSADVRVKVMYFQMPLVVEAEKEYFVLPNPAHYSDLLEKVLQEHQALSPMMPGMMVLIDGVLAKPGTTLSDGDEVDFIPAVAGG